MSVCNFSIDGREILILSDTLSYHGESPFKLTECKVSVSGNGRFAFEPRGYVKYGTWLGQQLESLESFDDAERRVGEIFSSNSDHLVIERLARAESHFDRALDLKEEMFLFGDSDRRGRLAAIRLKKTASAFEVEEYPDGIHLHPGIRMPIPVPSTVVTATTMVRLALAQHKLAAKYEMNLCIGGRMHITRVGRGEVLQWEAGRYPDYAEHADLRGDPLAPTLADMAGIEARA